MKVPDELKHLYADGRVLPFVGAGVSMSVHWDGKDGARQGLSWSELVDEAARRLGFEDPSLARIRGNDLQILEYYRLMNEMRTAPLTNWLVSRLDAADSDLKGAPILRELAAMDRCSCFYTTNFDDFVERALRLHGRRVNLIASEADMAAPKSECEVVKFHGDLNHPDKMVLTESDYEKRLKFQSEMDYRLRSDVLGRAVVFIGYSFRDPNVAYLFRLVNEQFGGLPSSLSGTRAYIVVPNPSQFEKTLFHARNITVIPVDGIATPVTDAVASVLQEIRS
jgi:hypothetical protein